MTVSFRYPLIIVAAVFAAYGWTLFSNPANWGGMVLHAATGIMFFLLCRELGFRSMVGMLAALTFVLHPQWVGVVLEAADWRSVAGALLTLAAVYAVCRFKWIGILAATVIQVVFCWIMPEFILLPLIIMAMLFLHRQRFIRREQAYWGILLLLTLIVNHVSDLMLSPVIPGNYGMAFWRTLLPVTMPSGSLIPFYLLMTLLLVVGISLYFEKRSFLYYWLLPCLVGFLFSPLSFGKSDYLAASFVILAAFAGIHVYWHGKYRRPVAAGVVIYILILSGVCVAQLTAWYKFQEQQKIELEYTRKLYDSMVNYLDRRDWENAARVAKAIRRNPTYEIFEDYLYHGIAALTLRNYDEAEDLLNRGLVLRPNNDIGLKYLGAVRNLREKDRAPANSTRDN